MPRISLVSALCFCLLGRCTALHFDSDDGDGISLLQQRSTARRTRVKPSSSALFIAGLEGSGHHLWGDLVKAMENEARAGTLPFQVKKTWLPALHPDQRLVTWECQTVWEHTDIEIAEETFANITHGVGRYDGTVYDVDSDEDTIWVTTGGSMSYPCGTGTHEEKRTFIPRADWLAEAAARVDGVVLHVGFMYRPLEELLLANCVHRKLEDSCDLYVDTMLTNAEALVDQLQTMDAMPGSKKPVVQCLRYGDVASYPKGLGVLFNHQISFDSIFGRVWKPNSTDTKVDHHYGEDPRDLVPNWDQLVAKLKGKDAELKAACDQHDLI